LRRLVPAIFPARSRPSIFMLKFSLCRALFFLSLAAWLALRIHVGLAAEANPTSHLDFTNDIVPVLSKQGCNSGACHGKAIGQNGFKLSLFGFDPAFDYAALVHEGRGRRISAAAPEDSLLLLKAAGGMAHGGG